MEAHRFFSANKSTPAVAEQALPHRRHGSGRRARRLLVCGLLLFVTLQVLLGLVLDQACLAVTDPEYCLREERLLSRLAQAGHRPSMLMFGSSRVSNGFEAQVTEDLLGTPATVFNFGIPTSGPTSQRIWLERLRRRGIRPDIAIFEVMPPYFHEQSLPLELGMMDSTRLSFGELLEYSWPRAACRGPLRKWAMARLFPTRQYNRALQEQLGLSVSQRASGGSAMQLAMDANGWIPVPAQPGTRREDLIGLAHRQYDQAYRNFRLSAEQVQAMQTLIESARSQQIRVALIVMPEGSEFRSLYSPTMRHDLDQLLAAWKNTYDLRVIDARDWLDDGWFYDQHHLIQLGATSLAVQLVDHLRPLLEPKSSDVRPSDLLETHLAKRTCLRIQE